MGCDSVGTRRAAYIPILQEAEAGVTGRCARHYIVSVAGGDSKSCVCCPIDETGERVGENIRLSRYAVGFERYIPGDDPEA